MAIADNLRIVRDRIADTAEKSGRDAASVCLVGVSKNFGPELVAEAIDAGLLDVGENRIQEAATKIPLVHPATGIIPRWHLVGHLQTNKVKVALSLFDTIQSVDSVRLAQAISRRAERATPIYLEVQFAHTPDRFGFEPDGLPAVWDDIAPLPNLEVVGLMTVAPLGLSNEETRRVFRTLRERRDDLLEVRPGASNLGLSMGMSEDFTIAIEEGATVVRIGRAIFAG